MTRRCYGAAVLVLLAMCAAAEELRPENWKATGADGSTASAAIDGRLETTWESPGPQEPGVGLTLDLGRSYTLHRIYLNPGDRTACFPRGIEVRIGDRPGKGTPAKLRNLSRDGITDLRFPALRGRYVSLDLTEATGDTPWVVAEILLFGFGPGAAISQDCVVCDAPPGSLLWIAASDLSYYLEELSGHAVALVAADAARSYGGAQFKVLTPEPFPSYQAFIASSRFKEQEQFSVQKDGEDVVFQGATHRAVMHAVYEFLHRQGVRWLYPDELGDFVPIGRGLDLTVLPLSSTPSFSFRYANWNTEQYDGDRADYLWYFRNRWSKSWAGRLNLRPDLPLPERTPWLGYTHTFSQAVPADLYEEHPDWFPLLKDRRWVPRIGEENLGRRIPYGTTWGLNFCTSDPDVVTHVANWIVDNTRPSTVHETVWLTPMDAGVFCECPQCLDLDDPQQKDPRSGMAGISMSRRYMTFISEVATRVADRTPNITIGAFAYSGYLKPPTEPARLPDNVVVDVVQYGIYNLPLSSPRNAEYLEIMNGWNAKWAEPGHVGVYDWALLLAPAESVPVPLVSALAERMRTYAEMGVTRVGTQADGVPDVWKYNPWNFYAYTRLTWDATRDPDAILRDFFLGYYREAGIPMLGYYRAIEDYLIENDISIGETYHYEPQPATYPYDLLKKMKAHLVQAAARSRHWVTRERVRAAIDGFEVAIRLSALTPEDLESVEGLRRIQPGRVLRLPARDMPLKTVGAESGSSWQLDTTGRIAQQILFSRPGRYRIMIEASGTPYDGVWPRMRVRIGPREFATHMVSSTTRRLYRSEGDVDGGVWQLAIDFMNDAVDKKQDRNLKVKTVWVEPLAK